MAEYLIQDTTLTAIANAVRAKTKKSDAILVSNLAEEINQIPLGGDSSETYGYTLFLTVVSTPGTEVTLSKDEKSYTKNTDASCNVVFNGLESGTWKIIAIDGEISISIDLNILQDMIYKCYLTAIPSFTYDGDYQILNDNDEAISTSSKNWKIKFLTSGTLNFTNLNGAADGIDVFLVGGGGNGNVTTHNGGGGGGGYTLTKKNVSISEGTYSITVGGSAGKTTAFGFTANPGGTKEGGRGGDGGSGGGSAGASGGSNGGNGRGAGGAGQGTTTREFGESTGKLYAGGGGGSWCYNEDTAIMPPGSGGSGGGGNGTRYDGSGGTSGAANTGGGGGGGSARAQGGSGIVIIRNKR